MTKFQFWLLALWLTFTVLAFSYFIQNKLTDFDAENKLENVTHQQLAAHLLPFVTKNDSSNKIIHFSKRNCDCQKTSEVHIQQINDIALDNDIKIINVELNHHDIIPATPSIAVLNQSGEVVYYGPYGQGIACSQTAGYAQTILKNYLKGYESHFVITKAKGCYCLL